MAAMTPSPEPGIYDAGAGRPILVTGATGFIGHHLCKALLHSGYQVRGTVRERTGGAGLPAGVKPAVVGDIGQDTAWTVALEGIACVVHLAARVHVLRETETDPLAAFLRANARATERLARDAAASGVRRLVFASSVRVNGPFSVERPFTEADSPAPDEPYEISKLEAERALLEIALQTGLETVILRVPLVYGPGVKANFLSLMRAVDRRVPLPLAAIRNRRSLIYVGNLVSAILACIEHPAAKGRTFMVADGEDVSSPELARRLARALGRAPLLLPVPPALLRFAGQLAGRRDAIERLCGSLQVDASAIRAALDWRPPFTMAQGIEDTARWLRRRGQT